MQAIKNQVGVILLSWATLCQASQNGPTDSNIIHPVADIERKLRFEIFQLREIAEFSQLRFQAKLAKVKLPKRVILKFADGTEMKVKWKTVERGGKAFNNQPRYEIAAYEFQKLFLRPAEYVVPPTVGRCLHVQQYRSIEPDAKPTFRNTNDVFFVLQYWLSNVSHEGIFDKQRFQSDSVYARYFANMNLFSYLIKHSDSNVGNVLISTDPHNPRVFAVDNGIAFGKAESDRGTEWQELRVKRLPKAAVERLRGITHQEIERTLGVVAQFEIKYGQMVAVESTENLNPQKGIRQQDGVLQFGLTEKEINGIVSRLEQLLSRLDSGKIQTF